MICKAGHRFTDYCMLRAIVVTSGRPASASGAAGRLPGIGVLLGIVIVTQVLAVVGVGGWFPYAAPGMWSGMGGDEVAASVTALQLLLALPVGAAGVGAALWWWGRAEVV